MHLKRWTLLAAAAIALPQSVAAETTELKVSHFLPPVHQMHVELVRWSKDLEKRSGGKLKLKIFPSGQMGPPPRQFDLARTGVADIAFLFPALNAGRFEMTEVFRAPFLFTKSGKLGTPITSAEASYITTKVAPDLAREYPGVKILYLITTTAGGLFMSKAAVNKPSDLKGLRVRHNGKIIAANLAAWGGTPVSIAPGEITDAISKGTIDGAVFNFEAARAFRFGKVVRKVTPLNWSVGTFALVMNRRSYQRLDPALRKLIDETTGPRSARRIGALYDKAEAAGRKYMLAAGTEIIKPTPEQFAAFNAALTGVTAKWVNDLEARKRPVKALLTKVRGMVAKSPAQ